MWTRSQPTDARSQRVSTKQITAAKPASPEQVKPAQSPQNSPPEVLRERPPRARVPAPVAETAVEELKLPAPSAKAADEREQDAPVLKNELVDKSAREEKEELVEARDEAAPTKDRATTSHRGQRTAKRPKEEAPADMVVVNIVTPGGWADVYLKGTWLGTTPARLELPAGRHALTLRPFGDGAEIVRKVELTKDNPLKLKVAVD